MELVLVDESRRAAEVLIAIIYRLVSYSWILLAQRAGLRGSCLEGGGEFCVSNHFCLKQMFQCIEIRSTAIGY
jgi:hypothetical protein